MLSPVLLLLLPQDMSLFPSISTVAESLPDLIFLWMMERSTPATLAARDMFNFTVAPHCCMLRQCLIVQQWQHCRTKPLKRLGKDDHLVCHGILLMLTVVRLYAVFWPLCHAVYRAWTGERCRLPDPSGRPGSQKRESTRLLYLAHQYKATFCRLEGPQTDYF
jgi:hypothetical protein